MKTTLTHCALHAQDLDKSIAFYERFCGLKVVRRHGGEPNDEAAWLVDAGRETLFVMVLVSGGQRQLRTKRDLTHYGFSVESCGEVNRIAKQAALAGCLLKKPRKLPHPVGCLCFLEDPDGYSVAFSYGQLLGPGADDL